MSERSGEAKSPPVSARLFFLCLLAVMAFRLALFFLPYRTLRRWMPPASTTPDSRFYARKVGYHVSLAAAYVPRASCLTQALAGQYVLARSGYAATIKVGVARREGGVAAHAWLLCDGRIVLGGHPAELEQYTPLVELN